jgi:hypothetical protein
MFSLRLCNPQQKGFSASGALLLIAGRRSLLFIFIVFIYLAVSFKKTAPFPAVNSLSFLR